MWKGIIILGKDDQKVAPDAGSTEKMFANRFFSFLLTLWLYLSAVLSTLAFLVCVSTTQVAFASNSDQPDTPLDYQAQQLEAGNRQDRRPPPRIPPRAAIEACEGRKEGERCKFYSPEGIMAGECLSGSENVFACRPYRDSPPPTEVQGMNPTPRRAPRSLSNLENGTIPQKSNKPAKKAGPLPEQRSSNQAEQPEIVSPQFPASTGPAPPAEYPLKPTPPQSPSIYNHLIEYSVNLAYYLIVAIISAGLTWYIFFRYTTLPLRRLRKVTQQLAGGDLSARVGEGLVRRKNEVVELGRDVDRMAERIESLVGAHQRLIRDVSHELRSPLARLNVALELARQSAGPTHAAPFDRIERESERLNELIGQLLMLTKLESESGMAERMDVDIALLIVEITQDVDYEAKSHDCSVTTSAGEPLQLKGNRELLRQALENLVRNAVRYTAPETAVEISLQRKESGGRGWAHIEVRDQGPGVPDAELQNIFRPFYRVNDARDRQSGGAGVGLAISDRAVRLHGGTLRAFNAPGGGLVMELELPLK
jgi:signal transduction histidine kinase